jgi:competence protein ComEC
LRTGGITTYNADMKDFLDNQVMNKFFWIPMLLAFGASFYFIMPNEPNVPHPMIAFITGMIILLFGKMNFVLRGLMLFLCGFLYAVFYTHVLVDTPVLKYSVRDKIITATVTDIDVSDTKTRLLLSVPSDDLTLPKDANIKVTVPDNAIIPQIGNVIRAKVSVFPPNSMEAPESFDYARWSYFNNLTATGYIVDYNILNQKDDVSVNNLRNKIHQKSNSFLTDGLILGYKNSVPKSDKETWTTAGIGHIWSISGFHMTLIGGWLFALFYLIFRSIGFITRRVPARIVATICAWIILAGYVCISGASVATLRAFLMTSLVFVALLFGRNAISMRNICVAFLILFFVNPHFVTTAGFQLSFAAIFGLIWFFGDKNFGTSQTFITKIKTGFYVATMTAIIATLFTLPFIATHFSSVPLYSLLGNLILLPIFSFAIMPLVLIGTICAMFGGHMLLNLATSVYNFALHIAQSITNMPGANLILPHIPDKAFAFLIIGFLFLIFIKPVKDSALWIYRYANYILFGICILIGTTIIAVRPHPVFYITPDHELIGMVYDGKLEFNKARASNHYFAFDAFRKLNNEPPADTNIRHKCLDGVCIYKSDKFTIAYIQKFKPLQKHFADLCRDDDIDFIVSYFDISAPRCNHKILHNGFVIYKSGHIKYTPTNRWWNNPHE